MAKNSRELTLVSELAARDAGQTAKSIDFGTAGMPQAHDVVNAMCGKKV
jgi:hypothetical protein